MKHAAVVYQNLSQVRKSDIPVVVITTLRSNFHIQLLILKTRYTVLAVVATKSS